MSEFVHFHKLSLVQDLNLGRKLSFLLKTAMEKLLEHRAPLCSFLPVLVVLEFRLKARDDTMVLNLFRGFRPSQNFGQ